MAILRNHGDKLEGERIYIEARKIEKRQPVNRTGRHKAETAVATDNWKVVCVIERPIRATQLSAQKPDSQSQVLGPEGR